MVKAANTMMWVPIASLLFMVMLICCSEKAWAGGTLDTAQVISIGTTVTDQVTPAQPTDFFKFTTTSAGNVAINFKHADVGYSWDKVWSITVQDNTGKQYLTFISYAESLDMTNKVGLPAGTYYVRISVVDGYYYNNPYQLTVGFSSGNNFEVESNDTLATANLLEFGTTSTAALQTKDVADIDYFKLTTTSAGNLAINFKHADVGYSWDAAWSITVQDSAGKQYLTFVSYAESLDMTNKVGLPAGTYYVRISDVAGITYNQQYQLTVGFSSGNNFEVESNDTLATANTVDFGTTYTAALQTKNVADIDYYKFTTTAAGNAAINFKHADVGYSWDKAWSITVQDNAGKQYLAFDSYAESLDTTNKAGLPAGTYYVKISDVNGYSYNQQYQLKVCTSSISPSSQSFTYKADTGSIGLIYPCGWNATSSVSWIKITDGQSGSGNGTVSYAVSANPTTSPRTGTITIGDNSFTVTQTGLAIYSLSSGRLVLQGAAGGTSASQTITIINSGSVPLELLSLAISGNNAADFSLSNDMCSNKTISFGNTCSFAVTLNSAVSGLQRAAVNIAGNIVNYTATVALYGMSGMSGNRIIQVPTNYSKLQDAVDAAVAGDIIKVAAGTFNESVSIGKKLVLMGEGNGNTTISSLNMTAPVDLVDLSTSQYVVLSGVSGANIKWLNCSFSGMTGGNSPEWPVLGPGGNGFAAAGISGDFLVLEAGGSDFHGGRGGTGIDGTMLWGNYPGGNGGYGLSISGTYPTIIGGSFYGGSGGAGGCTWAGFLYCAASGAAGKPIYASAAPVNICGITAPDPAVNTAVVNCAPALTSSAGDTSTYGQAVTFTATVYGPAAALPTGTVTFMDGSTAIGIADVNAGSATLTTAALSAGDHSITAVYSGDANHPGSTSFVHTQNISKAPQTINFPSILSKNLGAIDFDAAAIASSGLVVSYSSSDTSVATIVSGRIHIIGTGKTTITASQSGDEAYVAAKSIEQLLTVVTTASTIEITLSPADTIQHGKPVTITATVNGSGGIPSGTATFMDDATPLGTVMLNGSGQCEITLPSLPVGSHIITAIYGGDTTYAASISAKQTYTVTPIMLPLEISILGNGYGSVHSKPVGISCASGSNSGCSVFFAEGTKVDLSTTPSSHSSFGGWSVACTGSDNCEITMDAAKRATATFIANPATVRIDGDPTSYYAINTALNAIDTDRKIVRTKMGTFTENVVLSNPLTIHLKGGYSDNDFSTIAGTTIIDGSLEIRKGAIIIEQLTLQ